MTQHPARKPAPSRETPFLRNVLRILGSRPDVRLFRNSVGTGFVGRVIRRVRRSVSLEHCRVIRFGLPPGSGDLVGYRMLIITPDMVGKQIAQFMSVEVKSVNGRVRDKQENWRQMIRRHGGLALILKDDGKGGMEKI